MKRTQFYYLRTPNTPVDVQWLILIIVLYINGCRFSLYLQNGSENEPHEIAFVFDARFNFGSDHNKIVTNSKKGGAWGSEDHRHLAFPFHPEQDFRIKITVDDDSFKMKVNGEKFLEYEQKLSMKSINCIRIQNDIVIEEIKLK
ncbi:hypothetical protein DPMN_086799 [Dreissena polymorpha]|uniref:Galectin n=1 Tax=Dreissena polymorpha TaxID=45954 RepID=A0A9D4KRN7_DREPO|nr:hypothetical protein DPMN_086799 [Dreissena polymorpha]